MQLELPICPININLLREAKGIQGVHYMLSVCADVSGLLSYLKDEYVCLSKNLCSLKNKKCYAKKNAKM